MRQGFLDQICRQVSDRPLEVPPFIGANEVRVGHHAAEPLAVTMPKPDLTYRGTTYRK